MKKILILPFILALFSCSLSQSNTPEKNETWMIQETKQILNDYPDTMIQSIHDAKKVKEQYNQNWTELQDSIQKSKVN